MQFNPLQQPTGNNTSDVTWERLLDILNSSSQTTPQPAFADLTHGAHRTLDNPSSPSLTGSSSSHPPSPRDVTILIGRDPFAAPSPSTSQQQQQQQQPPQHHPSQQIYPHPHARQSQLHPHPTTSQSSHTGLLLLGQLTRRAQAVAAVAAPHVDTAVGLDPEAASVSASAERHRLISNSAGVSFQVFVEWSADLIPFLLLLAWVFIFKHAGVLLLILFLAGCTFHANADIRRLIAMQREARVSTCVSQALTVTLFTTASVLATLPDTQLLRVLTLRTAQTSSAVDTVLLVLLADGVLRFGSLAPKLMVVAWFRNRGAAGLGAAAGAAGSGSSTGGHLSGAQRQRQQTRVLTVVERLVALYRSVLPGPVWYNYLLHGGGFSPVLASLFCGFYVVLKASYVIAQMRLFALALKTATRRSALYGTYMGRVDGGEEGGFSACPVCQDLVNTPVRLDCGHIFCEECILEWLERDRTCPMCRAQVRPAGLPSCSDGASPLLPQVF